MASIFPKSIAEAAQKIACLLHERGETVSFAETATGGILSASLLATPGASKIYAGGLTLYTLGSRLQYGGWKQADIDNYRGPTTSIVTGIARNVNAKLASTYTLCESGTAGPTGGSTRERTPGFVALAVIAKDGSLKTKEVETGSADREANMIRFAEEAFALLAEMLEERGKEKL